MEQSTDKSNETDNQRNNQAGAGPSPDGNTGRNDQRDRRPNHNRRNQDRPKRADGAAEQTGQARDQTTGQVQGQAIGQVGDQPHAKSNNERPDRRNQNPNRQKQVAGADEASAANTDQPQTARPERTENRNRPNERNNNDRRPDRNNRPADQSATKPTVSGDATERPAATAQPSRRDNPRDQNSSGRTREGRGQGNQRTERTDRTDRTDRADRIERPSGRQAGRNASPDEDYFDFDAKPNITATPDQISIATLGRRPLMTIGISIGDFNGIGPETILQIAADNRITELVQLVVYGNTKLFKRWATLLDLPQDLLWTVKEGEPFKVGKVNIVNVWEEDHELSVGQAKPEAGVLAFKSIQAVVEAAKAGVIDAIVTAPINKANMSEDFTWPGHTEYFAQAFGTDEGLMLMVADEVRIALATAHIPLAEVPRMLSTPLLEDKIKTLLKTLRQDFGIEKPRIAILGLNPHAGEAGKLGREELEIMIPLITKLAKAGNLVVGPYPADGFFGAGQQRQFDGVLAMYHDQGLAPFKTLSFDSGVNYTGGLSVVRTSPDHGTAFNIAGKGIADANSLRQAIYLASDIVRLRKTPKRLD